MNKVWKLLIFSTLLTFNANAAMTSVEEGARCCDALIEWYNQSYFHDNFNIVCDGQLYRSATLDAERLEHYIQNPGIKTVVNLQNEQPNAEWWQDETRICHEHGVTLINLETACDKPVKREVFEQLIHIFKEAPKPILIHGVARTGEIAALWLITQWNPEEIQGILKNILYDTQSIRETFNARTDIALEQLSLWYLHIDWLNPKRAFIRKVGDIVAEMMAVLFIKEISDKDPFTQAEFLAEFLDRVYAGLEDKKDN